MILLSSFVAVLDEPGLRAARGDECVRIIVESLLRLGRDGSAGTEALRDGVQVYLAARKLEKDLFSDADNASQYEDVSFSVLACILTQNLTHTDVTAARNSRLHSCVRLSSGDRHPARRYRRR